MNYHNDKFKDYNFQAGKEAIKYPMTGAPKTYLAVGVIGFVLILNLIRWFYTAQSYQKSAFGFVNITYRYMFLCMDAIFLISAMYKHKIKIKSNNFLNMLFIMTICLTFLPELMLCHSQEVLPHSLRTQLELYKNMEGDYRWLTDMRCAMHGYSYPSGGITQIIESGVNVIDDNKADIYGFIENIFGHLEDRKVRSLLEAKLKAISYTEGAKWTKDELSTSFEVDGSIAGIHYALYSDKIQNQSKRQFFIAIVQISISAGPGHYFIAGYFNGQEECIKNALKYLLYKEAKNKLLIH
ncbi:13712_t:CDS:2 [Entrophospora sp. SA101]|nr:13712_t:CDS:2 [Entrophospora sp. SA101]CAJ0890356.1 12094_t:CDS:2 [Entrophospora sp. SA101]